MKKDNTRSKKKLNSRGGLIFILVCVATSIFCKDAKIDSLKQVLTMTTNDTTRYQLCRQIGDLYYEGDFDSLLVYYDKSLVLAKKIKDVRGQLSTLRSFAYVHRYRKNDYDKAAQYFKKALRLAKEKNDTLPQAYILFDIGELYRERGENVTAIEYLFNANKQAEKLGHKHLLAGTWHSLGEVYNQQKEYKKALSYFQNALPFTVSDKEKRMRGALLNSMGKNYLDMGDFAIAQSSFLEAMDLFKQIDDNDLQVDVHVNLAKKDALLQKHDEAIKHYKIALQLNELVENKNRQVMILAELAAVNLQVNDYEAAHLMALKGDQILKEVDTKLHREKLASILSKTYAHLGSYKRAFHYSEIAKIAKDSLQLSAANKKLTDLNTLYEKEKKAVEMEQLRANNAEQELLLSRSRFTTYSIAFFSILCSLLTFLWFKNMRIKHLKRYKQLRIQLTHDLHDNVSSSLNHIKMMANRLTSNRINDHQKEKHVQQIKTISNEVVGDMYDLIWSLDDSKQTIADLIHKMRDYASNVFTVNGLSYQLKDNVKNKETILSAHLKNNIYSIFKESINNIVKHTHPDKVEIVFTVEKKHFTLKIVNDTYKIKQVKRSSNIGLTSIKKRAKDILGKVEINEQDNLFTIQLIVPI